MADEILYGQTADAVAPKIVDEAADKIHRFYIYSIPKTTEDRLFIAPYSTTIANIQNLTTDEDPQLLLDEKNK